MPGRPKTRAKRQDSISKTFTPLPAYDNSHEAYSRDERLAILAETLDRALAWVLDCTRQKDPSGSSAALRIVEGVQTEIDRLRLETAAAQDAQTINIYFQPAPDPDDSGS